MRESTYHIMSSLEFLSGAHCDMFVVVFAAFSLGVVPRLQTCFLIRGMFFQENHTKGQGGRVGEGGRV